MGYLIPVDAPVSSNHQDHRARTPPSQEPGTDYACGYGTPLVAPENGWVVDYKTSNTNPTGRYVTIDFDDGRRVRFLHLSEVLVKGGRVGRGQVVALSGASGNGSDWGVGQHVHVTLWAWQAYVFGPNGTLDFEDYLDTEYSQTVADQQNWLNIYRNAGLVVDGRMGAATKAAIADYQVFLGVPDDGVWGPTTQTAHQIKYNEWLTAQAPPIEKEAAEMATIFVTTSSNGGSPIADKDRRGVFADTTSGFECVISWFTLDDADRVARACAGTDTATAVRLSDSGFDRFLESLLVIRGK